MEPDSTPRLRRLLPAAALVLCGLLPLSRAVCTTEPVLDFDTAIATARERLEALRAVAGIPGLSVAVAAGDRIVWSEGLGTASLETPSPVTPATRFRAGSVSKVLTVAAVARLSAQGRLDLDAPIQRYVPGFPEPEEGVITARLLAGHLGGIRNYQQKDWEEGGIDRLHFESLANALVLFAKDPTVALPGAEYHYSTFGYTLLGAAVAAATDEPFLAVLERQVFRPLGMTRSGPDEPTAVLPGRTQFYDPSPQGVRRGPSIDPSYKWPGGGLLTTSEDLVRFGNAHLSDRFLPALVRESLFTSQTTADGEETGVGLGWRLGTDWRGRRVFHHAGSMSGARAVLLIFPDHHLVAALMTNLKATPALVEQTLQLVLEPFFDTLGAELPSENPPALPPAGTYRYDGEISGEGVTPTKISGALVLQATPEGGLRGSMTTPAWVSGVLLANGLPDDGTLPFLAAVSGNGRLHLILATPFGLHPLAIEVRDDGFRAELDVVGPTQMRLEALRLSG